MPPEIKAGSPVDRPLRLGEVFAEAVRIYGERIGAALALGAFTAVMFVIGLWVHPVLTVVLLATALTVGWAAASRLVAGDDLRPAALQVGAHAPALLVLTVVAALPFALALSQLFLVIFAVAWLAATGFAIPVVVNEQAPEELDALHRLGFALRRSITLARTEYVHAVGVIAALVLTYALLGFVLVQTLRGFAENGDVAAVAIAQVVLAPFFFLGLAVLYFDQTARAVSSRRGT